MSIDGIEPVRDERKDRTGRTCHLWRGLAEIVEKYVNKGDKLFVKGKMLSREYEKDGVKYTAWEVTATEIELLTPKKDGNGQDTKSAPSTTQQAAKESDDLPF